MGFAEEANGSPSLVVVITIGRRKRLLFTEVEVLSRANGQIEHGNDGPQDRRTSWVLNSSCANSEVFFAFGILPTVLHDGCVN
jgi:hypothetical protein